MEVTFGGYMAIYTLRNTKSHLLTMQQLMTYSMGILLLVDGDVARPSRYSGSYCAIRRISVWGRGR